MLKKLRIKFVLVNMLIVTILLGGTFGVLFHATSQNLERETVKQMENIGMQSKKIGPMQNRRLNMPHITVTVDRDGNIVDIAGTYTEAIEEEEIEKIVSIAAKCQERSGQVPGYDLIYLRTETPKEINYVFVDNSMSKAVIHAQIRSMIFIGIGVYLLFFGISILLARWAVKPVEDAWKQQKQFVADASHELKTPLTVILTDADLLRAQTCSEQDRTRLANGILNMAQQMRGLVESLLDLARMESGSNVEQFTNVDLSNLVTNEAMIFEPVMFEHGKVFSYEITPNIQVKGNGIRLKQLVDILLDNAIKYGTDGGRVELILKENKNKCVLEVANQGDSIPQKELQQLFQRFYRGDKARTMNQSYGLGLSIAEAISKEHGGKIWAESKNGYNRFYVELPKL